MLSRYMLVAISAAAVASIAVAFAHRLDTPTSANPLEGISQIAGGGNHTCAITQAGGAECWGENTDGELGDGTTVNRGKPGPVLGLSNGVTAIAAGANHTCALLSTGGVKCWGYNRYGQLGNGTATGATGANPEPLDVSGLQSGVTAITAGGAHTCALLTTGGVKCWGWNRRGQVGDGEDCSVSQCRRLVPTDVTGLTSGVAGISAGVYHTCAVLSTGSVKCWGQNDAGQLGAATGSPCVNELLQPIACAPIPVEVAGLSGVISMAAGYLHTCALMTPGGVKCWGANSSGQLGDGGACGPTCGSPVDVSGIATAAAIAAGSQHTCALLLDTRVQCWGANSSGQLGDGSRPTDRSLPANVCADASCAGPLNHIGAIALGADHSCALTQSGSVKCWGSNSAGQLGDSQGCGTVCDIPVDVLVPKSVPTPTPAATPRAATGDANCDGSVNSIDAALVLQYSAGLLGSLLCQSAADVNHDGVVNSIDAALILQYVAGLLGSLS